MTMTEWESLSREEEYHNFRKIFLEYYKPLCCLSVHYLDDESEAKEVVQDAFMKLWEVRNALKDGSNLKNFLFTLVKNECLNILKRRQILLKHHETIKQIELRYHVESLGRMNTDFMEVGELEKRINQAIEHLPMTCRTVFEMSRFQDLKNREIAEKLGVVEKTVEAHLTRALKLLRQELRDYLPFFPVFCTSFSHFLGN
ncbi:MAG: RNA polymerase sigma-70 factor [Mangrovibacterium sp.]